ncbi:hypothetical protein M9H77_06759 [Catharanthus roseus]|uniref:Uncharacterized protein n=1 Tax=Catharanthus roseus TaxID=4058 RepID=A0ACC0BT87_CATRO|nr:hypothetical protein M9H77_06759 [Catharanthus roseus]
MDVRRCSAPSLVSVVTASTAGSDAVAAVLQLSVTSGPSQEHTHVPETNEELDIPSSVLDPASVPETNVPGLEGSDDENDHAEAQAQALRDYHCLEIGLEERIRKPLDIALLCTLLPLLVSTRRTPLQAIEMLAPSVF